MSDANAPELAAEDGLQQGPAAADDAPLPGDLGEGELPADPAAGDEAGQAAEGGMPAQEEGLLPDEGAAPPEEGLMAEPGEGSMPGADAGDGLLPDEPTDGLGEAVPAEAGEEGEGFQPPAEELGGEAALEPASMGEEAVAQDGMGDDAALLGGGEEAAVELEVQEGGEEAAMGQEDGQGDVMAAADGDGAYPEAGEMAAAEYLEGGEIPAEYPGEMAAAEYLEGGELPPAEYAEGGAAAAEYLEGGEIPADYAGAGEFQEGPVDDEQYQQQLPHPYYPTAPQADDEQALMEQEQYGQGALGQPAAAGLVDEEAQLEEQRRALEEENAALLAEQVALTEQEQQQQQEQYGEQYGEPAAYGQQPEDPAYEGGYITSAAAEDPYPGGYASNAEHQAGDGYPEGGYASRQQELPPPQPAVDIDALLAEEREKHEQQLKMETRAREELEDMILRIEKHFKAEQAARKKAEELLQQAIAAEMDAKNKLEDVMKKRGQEQRLLDEERNAIKRERHALESMRQEFENELQAARTEVAKAQEALAGSEERIRSAEQVERARLEAEYQSKLSSMQGEMDRMRDEMTYRTMVMQDEMENWRQQAQITANAVLEAKSEVMERKRELDSTKEKMDRLLDKLLMGRERGIELSGAIASNQRMLGYLPGMGYGMGGMPGQPISLPPMGQQLPSIGMSKMPPAVPGPQGPWMNNMMGGGANMMGGAGGNMMGGNMMGGAGGNMMGGGGNNMMGAPGGSQYQQQQNGMGMAPPGKSKLPPLVNGYPSGMNGSWSAGSWGEGSPGPQPRRASSVDNLPDYAADEQYAPVQSRFAQNAAEVGLAAKAKQRSMAKNNNNRSKKADRFEEAEKEAKRNAAMSKWN